MPTQKIDPKVIFASNAPAIDKPPVFSDKTKGWDVARANDGRPTIKEMNKVQQDTDLKILWLNENSVTSYDESIDYPDGAVSIKDGSFKQFVSGAWVEFLDGFANKDEVKRGIANRYDSSLTYKLNERVVLTNGDIVKSTIDGNTNDPNVDMIGWVKDNSASQVFDESGKTQQDINDETKQKIDHLTVDIRDFGAKCDNYTDDSVAIQAAIDYVAAQGGGEVRCSGRILITQTITIRDKVSLVAPWIGRVSYNVYAAAIIRKTTPDPFFAHEATSLAWGLRNLLLVGSNVVNIGFDITAATHCNVDNCMFTDCVDIGWNFVSRTGAITFCEFTRLGNKGARIGAVIDYDSSVEGTYNNGNRYGFSIFLRHTEIGVWYKNGGSNTLESYGGEVASSDPNNISLRYDGGVAQMLGDWWAEPKSGNPIVVNGGVLTIVGNGRLLGEVIENGGIILWDQPVGVWQYPIFPSLQRVGIKHAYSFREGSLRDAMGNKDLTKTGTVDVNPDSSRYGSMMQLNGAGSYMYLDSRHIDWSQDWTIAICAKAVGNASATAAVALRIQKSVSDSSQYLALHGSPDNRFFRAHHYVDGVSQTSVASPVASTWGRVYQWGFIKYDSTAKKIYGSRGMEGEGDSFWIAEDTEIDLSTFLSDNSRVVFGQSGNNFTFRIDELLIMQRQITPKEMIAINSSAIDLEAMLGTIPVSTIKPSASITYDPPSIPAGESITTTATVNGAVRGDAVHVGFTRFNADIEITAAVSESNTVVVKFKNTSAAPIDLGSGTLNIKVI